MDQDQLKKAVAKAAVDHIPDHCIVGVGTGSTVNYFIDELAGIKGRIEGAVASSEASAARLEQAGIRVFDLNVCPRCRCMWTVPTKSTASCT